ncbi:RNA polymerase factor sigma-54 [Helicobacter sp. MIT 14-3879]|uniref:RNA polymerase factor sigma-54 n=1 Tax=Helicobacter sp. MIT 14-3879 TaxID=2040649 RepID=UPI000E1F0308|nr:RNA polymerase factor sigma-54 [Helicobacter sp. MIT 14-3879]RDU64657.1 RNA polymerase factor sigma-54 [Helicobacter sp. MIT 14-3879]
MKLKQAQSLKTKLSPTLKSWFPILQSSTLDLEEVLEEFTKENPFIEIQSNIQESLPNASSPTKPMYKNNVNSKKYMSEKIESMSIYEKSLYELLENQILPPLFPTPISQQIALKIIDDINEDGYFEGDINEIAIFFNVDFSVVEQIRTRFSKINPSGIAALNPIESMIFQLEDYNISDELYDLSFEIIKNLNNHKKYAKNPLYNDSMKIISRMKIPPALDYFPKDSQIIPDIFINLTSDGFEVNLNDSYYPDIFINKTALNSKNIHIKDKLKEGRDLIDALSMRKSTIKKIGLMLLEYQYDFFIGGDIKPLKLKDIAKELGHSPSTISRAVANKYIECNRGIYPIKTFFTTAITEETSNTSIKDFILECVKLEDKKNPLSDIKILEMVEDKFKVKIVRRTITKYRKQLNIGSSSERKRLYEVEL